MAWHIQCSDDACGESTWAGDIVDLIENHRDRDGWFLHGCGLCSWSVTRRTGPPTRCGSPTTRIFGLPVGD